MAGYLWLLGCVASAARNDGWKFLDRYPQQYLTNKLQKGEAITIDGRIDEQVGESTQSTHAPTRLSPPFSPPTDRSYEET